MEILLSSETWNLNRIVEFCTESFQILDEEFNYTLSDVKELALKKQIKKYGF